LDLGLIEYKKAWDLQREVFAQIKNRGSPSTLILCRHYPVITLGRPAKRNNILIPQPELKNKGISVYEIERGGDVTYHGPGQLTAYPIFNLAHLKKDIHFYLRLLEETVIDTLSSLGIYGNTSFGLTGVWVAARKIASIGIAIKNWITFHGVSINIKEADLANFSLIRSCDMDIEMTSVESVIGREIAIEEVKQIFSDKLRRVLWSKCTCRH